MDFEEISDNIKKTFGKNGSIFLIVGFSIVFIICYLVQSKKQTQDMETVQITGAYASYPDTVTNADTITDTMQESVDYQTDELKNFFSTYLEENKVDLSQLSEIIENQKSFGDSLNDIIDNITAIQKDVDEVQTLIDKDSNTTVINKIADNISSTQSVNASKLGTVKSGNNTNYYNKTSYNSVSIVDGLKSIGEYSASTFSGRTKIAKANGISNYKGTYKQNTELLNKLKNGELIRP